MSGETARDGAARELRDQIAEALQMAFVALLGNHETSTTGPLTYETLADAVMAAPALRVRLDLLAEYENAITWNTSCLACSRTLDASIRDHDRAERAEAAIERALDYLDALIANGFGATDGSLRALRTVLGGPAAEDLGRPLSSRHEDLLRELFVLSLAPSPAGGSEKEADPNAV
jgi:hypothetical protein